MYLTPSLSLCDRCNEEEIQFATRPTELKQDNAQRVLGNLETRAIMFNKVASLSKLSELFHRTLRFVYPKINKELEDEIVKAKDKIIEIHREYRDSDPQLNVIKILNLRFISNINKIVTEVDEIKNSAKFNSIKKKDVLINLINWILAVRQSIYDFERVYQSNEISKSNGINDDSKSIIDLLDVIKSMKDSVILSDSKTIGLLDLIIEDLNLINVIFKAPEVLFPLAILHFDMHSPLAQNEILELSKMLIEYKSFMQRYFSMQVVDESLKEKFKNYIHKSVECIKRCPGKEKADIDALKKKLKELDSLFEDFKKSFLITSLKNYEMCDKKEFLGQYCIISHNLLQRICYFSLKDFRALSKNLSNAKEGYQRLFSGKSLKTDYFTPMHLINFEFQNQIKLLEDRSHLFELSNKLHKLIKVSSLMYANNVSIFSCAYKGVYKELMQFKNYVIKATECEIANPKLILVLSTINVYINIFELFLISPSGCKFVFQPNGNRPLVENSKENEKFHDFADLIYGIIELHLGIKGSNEKLNKFKEELSKKINMLWKAPPPQFGNKNKNYLETYKELLFLIDQIQELKWNKNLYISQSDNNQIEINNFINAMELGVLYPSKVLARFYATQSLEKENNRQSEKVIKVDNSFRDWGDEEDTEMDEFNPNEHVLLFDNINSLAHQIQMALAGPKDHWYLKDFHNQILYHLKSLGDLPYHNQLLTRNQTSALLLAQACLLEQALKLLSVTHDNQKAQEVRTTHRFEELLSDVVIEKSMKDMILESNGFLIAARYGVGDHAWLPLLKRHSVKKIIKISKSNLMSLEYLLNLVAKSLPKPNTKMVISDSQNGLMEGILKLNLLHPPKEMKEISYSFKTFNTVLESLNQAISFLPLSHRESAKSMKLRKNEIEKILYILNENTKKFKQLTQDSTRVSWLMGYATEILLCAGVILEKSIEFLLIWLPVSDDTRMHYLFGFQEQGNNHKIQRRYMHALEDYFQKSIEKLTEKRESDEFVNKLRVYSEKLAWIQPFIQTYYRYPFSTEKEKSLEILGQFHSLSTLRTLIQKNELNSVYKESLLEKLTATPESLSESYDALLKNHLQDLVFRPAKEMFKASLEILQFIKDRQTTVM